MIGMDISMDSFMKLRAFCSDLVSVQDSKRPQENDSLGVVFCAMTIRFESTAFFIHKTKDEFQDGRELPYRKEGCST